MDLIDESLMSFTHCADTRWCCDAYVNKMHFWLTENEFYPFVFVSLIKILTDLAGAPLIIILTSKWKGGEQVLKAGYEYLPEDTHKMNT